MDQSPKKKFTEKVTLRVIDLCGWRARSSAKDFFLNITIFSALPYERIEIHHLHLILWLKRFYLERLWSLQRPIYCLNIAECDISQGLLAWKCIFWYRLCFVRSITLLHLFKTYTAFWQCNFGFSHALLGKGSIRKKILQGRKIFPTGFSPSPPPSPSSPPPPPPARPWCGEGGARVRRRTPGAGSTLS